MHTGKIFERKRGVKNVSTKTRVVTALALVLTMLLAAFSTVREVSAGGPVTANMLDRIYANAGLTEAALATGAIDLNDEPLSSTSILAWAGNPAITMDGYAAIDKFQVDLNNQWWPTGPNDPAHTSPGPKNTFFNPSGVRDVAALHFRRAVAHLANKAKYATAFMGGYAYVMETEIPVPALEGYTDYSTLINATAVADAGLGGYMYPYDRATAISEFELGGFQDYDADTFREWRDPGADGTYGTGDDGPIEELPNMKFYELSRGPWMSIAPDLYNELLSAGIPTALTVNSNGLWYIKANEAFFYTVMATLNYNFLVGGSWALGADPDFIYNLYYSGMGQYSYALNYPGFKNAEFDSFAERVKYPQSLGDLKFAVVQAQWVKAKYVPVIELFSSKGVKAYRTGWDDVINMAGYGIDNRYSFLLMNWIDGPGTSRSGPMSTIVYGLSFGPSDLHIITSGASWAELPVPQMAWYKLFGAKVLSQIYDSLIGRNPYNLPAEVGWLASSWSVTSNYPGWQGMSVAEFTVRTGAMFHDGSLVKPADVAFSILMPRDAGPGVAWNYPAVMDINRVEIQGQIVRVFFNTRSALALHWAGFLPIINKDLWDDAIGVGTAAGYTGFIPDDTDGVYTGGTFANPIAVRDYRPWENTAAGNPAVNDLAEDGSGPWVFTSYTIGNSVVLSSFASFYTTVNCKGQALPFKQFLNLAFHEIGDVNYPGSYGSSQVPPWYEPPSASWTFNPSSTDSEWTNPTNAYRSDNDYATTNSNEAMGQYSGYDTEGLTGCTIVSVELGVEAFSSVSSASISVSVSWDGGTSWAQEQSVNLPTTDPNTRTWKDFTGATAWNPSKLSNTNFRARVKAMFGGTLGTISLDCIPIRVVFLGAPAGNAKIDLFDLTTIVTSMPSTSLMPWGPGNWQFNPDADINNDGVVNIIDLATAGSNFGKTMG